VLNAKGHLDAHLFLFATANDIWIDAERNCASNYDPLERYVIADDVVIEDVTDQLRSSCAGGVRAENSGAKFCPRSRRLEVRAGPLG